MVPVKPIAGAPAAPRERDLEAEMSHPSNRAAVRNPNLSRATAAAVETLENRLLLTAVLSAKGTLAVIGTGGNDTIVVERHPTIADQVRATINGTAQVFNRANVRRVEIYGQSGNDNARLDDSLAILSRKGATLFGGAGNDTLVGGLAGVNFLGGKHADSILGGSRNDIIFGGDGADTIIGGRGNDRIFGDEGADAIRGWLGNDLMYGDAGNDTLFGEDGDDTLGGDGEDRLFFVGGTDPTNFAGNDSLRGGAGNDWLVGGRQSATLNDNNGLDTLDGGTGNDILDSRGWLAPSTNPFDTIIGREAGDIVPMEDYTRVATADEIAEGDEAYAVHDHADIIIRVFDNGALRTVRVQPGIGDFVDPGTANTSPRVHVHEGQEGRIHWHDLDAQDPDTFTLGRFFRNWGVSIDQHHIGRYFVGNGRNLTVTVDHNGAGGNDVETISDPYNYVIQGANLFGTGDVITITYQ